MRSIEDIKDLKLHVQTRLAGEAMRELGAHPVPMPSEELPTALTERVIDGCVDPWHMVPPFRLNDLLKAHTEFSDLSLSSRTYVLAMNKPAYERLPRDLKTVFDNNSDELAAGMAGAMWDLQAHAVAENVAESGDVIVTLLPEAVAHWRKATEPVVDGLAERYERSQVRRRQNDRQRACAAGEIRDFAGAAAAASSAAAAGGRDRAAAASLGRRYHDDPECGGSPVAIAGREAAPPAAPHMATQTPAPPASIAKPAPAVPAAPPAVKPIHAPPARVASPALPPAHIATPAPPPAPTAPGRTARAPSAASCVGGADREACFHPPAPAPTPAPVPPPKTLNIPL